MTDKPQTPDLTIIRLRRWSTGPGPTSLTGLFGTLSEQHHALLQQLLPCLAYCGRGRKLHPASAQDPAFLEPALQKRAIIGLVADK